MLGAGDLQGLLLTTLDLDYYFRLLSFALCLLAQQLSLESMQLGFGLPFFTLVHDRERLGHSIQACSHLPTLQISHGEQEKTGRHMTANPHATQGC